MAKNLKKIFWIILGVLFFALIIALQSGWRPELSFTLSGTKVSIEVPLEGSVIFVNEKEKAFTSKNQEIVSLPKIPKGEHTIVVYKENFWPWAKTVVSEKGKEIYLRSFHLPQRLDVNALALGSESRENARKRLSEAKTPSEKTKIFSADRKASLWVENNKIFAEWNEENPPHYFCNEGTCEKRVEVIASLSNIINADFLKERNDVLIFSNEEGVFAIEIDKTETQNFQPIWRVRNPKFVQSADGLFVEERGEIYSIEF